MVFIVIFMVAIFILIDFLVNYWLHVSLTKEKKQPYDYVKFKTFIKEYEKYKDCSVRSFLGGVCVYSGSGGYIYYLSDSEVQFGNKYMILYPIDYINYRCFLRKLRKNKNRVRGLWDENN